MDSPGPDTPLYSVAAIARHTGVPAVTLRAWERRYGFPRPSRASGGRRLYTQRDIWTVRALRMRTDQGVPISRAIALLGDASSPPPQAEQPIGAESPLMALVDQLLEALLDLAAGLAYEQVGQATPYVLAALVMALTAILVVRGQPRRSTASASAVRASPPAPLAEQST